MEDSRKSFLTNQIVSGMRFVRIQGERYKIIPPSLEIKLLAEHVYKETVESLRFDNFMNTGQVKTILNRLKTWTDKDEEELKKLETFLEDSKVILYKAFYDQGAQKQARAQIKKVKTAINKALSRKHSLDHTTLDFHALITKGKFIIALCLRDKDNKPVYTEESFWNSDSYLLEQAIGSLEKDTVTIEEIRELSRSDPWRGIWGTGKEKCFGTPSCDWTDEQRTIVIYSKMYDNAHQNMDCPAEEVFEDDDMFDGWMIDQQRKREEERKKKEGEAVTKGNFGNAGEVFITAPSHGDASKIYDLNEKQERHIIHEREAFLKRKGEVQAHEMPDTQRDIVVQAASEYGKLKH